MENSDYPFIAPSSSCISDDLLFFDTFSHSNSDKDNFDLVQFPSPVVIDLIKIVPLGQPVEAKIPGNVRLGATNPSNCELEFFINDLTKQDAHTMTDLGKFYCSERETDFSPPIQIQTDGLLLRGSYRTLTLAIFGQIATYDEKVEDDQVVLSAASPPAQTPASPVASDRDIPYIVRSVDQEILGTARDDLDSLDDSATQKSGELIKDDSMIDNTDMIDDVMNETTQSGAFKEQNIPGDTNGSEVYPISFGASSKKREEFDYSDSADIESYSKKSDRDRNSRSKAESIENNQDEPDLEAELEQIEEWSFNVDTYPPKPLVYFSDPSLTLQEKSILIDSHDSEDAEIRDKEVERVAEMFSCVSSSDESKSDEWVILLEEVTNDIANMSLSRIVADTRTLNLIVKQVHDGLNIELALSQKQAGYRVRHLRAGLKLATLLFHCGDAAVDALLDASIPQRVLQLYNQDQMSLPIRLLIFRCLSAMCDSVKGVDHIINHSYQWQGVNSLLKDIKQCSSNADQMNFMSESRPTQEQSELGEHNQFPHNDSTSKRDLAPSKSPSNNETVNLRTLTSYQFMIVILLSQPKTRVTIAIGNLMKKIRLYRNLLKLQALCFEEYQDHDGVFDSAGSSEQRMQLVEQSLPILQDVINLTSDRCAYIAQPLRYLPARVQFQVRPHSNEIYLALYKWLKHFRTIDCVNILLNIPNPDSVATIEIEKTVRVQSICLLLIQQIVNSTRGVRFYLSGDLCETTNALLRTLADKHPPKRSSHLRVTDGIENCLNASLCREETLLAASCNDLSLKLTYSFKVFSCIDKLLYFHRKSTNKPKETTLCDPEKVLHQLYILVDHPYGLSAMVKHFSCVGNLDCLLRFIDMTEPNKQLEFVKETSIDYALELIGTFLRLNNNVLEVSEEYLGTLLELCKTKDKNLSVRIKSLIPWMSPFESDQTVPLNYSEETFRQLTRVIRRSIPNYSIPFAKGLDFELPPQLITAVRILRQLCIPPQVESFLESNFDIYSMQKLTSSPNKSPSFMSFVDSLPHQQNQNQSWNLNLNVSRNNASNNNNNNNIYDDSLNDQLGQISNTFKLFQPYDHSICGELKYHYGIMQIFEHDGLKRLLNTLRELTGNYPRPIYQKAALSGFRGRIVLSYLHSVVLLLHSIICHLIDARGSEFKDTSIIPVILEVYSLLCFVPQPDDTQNVDTIRHENLASLQKSISIRSDNYLHAQQTKKLILSILMSYTQMCLSVSESEEKVISKSMWTRMLKEVIDFTLSTPVFFHHGLDILTKILPSPLPCSSVMDSIDQEQLFKNINHRKLWSAHLHPLHQQIEQMISHLSVCYQSNIRNLLYYLCNQLCDLSSNAACMVAKIIIDTLIHHAAKLCGKTEDSASPEQLNQSSHIQPEDKSNLTIESKATVYSAKMILNLLSSLITNQAFETALSNYLQMMGKKDEKLLVSLHSTLKLRDDYRAIDAQEESVNTGSCVASVTNLIDSIKAMNDNLNKEGYVNPVSNVHPPEELTTINLIELARKTSDRFSLTSGLTRTYRLKVLFDLNSFAHRSSESSSKRFDQYNHQDLSATPSHKPYVAPMRGRGRPQVGRSDVFRSRPQNTSRPPSIHVDDFIDIYGDSTSQANSRYGPSSGKLGLETRGGSSSRGNYAPPPPSDIAPRSDMVVPHRHGFFSQQPGTTHSGSPYNNRSQHIKSKYAKLK